MPRLRRDVAGENVVGINAEVNPNLRLSVLDESLFDWTCPHCGYQAMLVYPCLYHDKGRRFMIYILPREPDPQKAAGISAQFPQLRGVRKRVTSSLATLKEKSFSLRTGWTTAPPNWSSFFWRWCWRTARESAWNRAFTAPATRKRIGSAFPSLWKVRRNRCAA